MAQILTLSVIIFSSAVQEERTPYPTTKENKMPPRRTKSASSLQHSPTIPRKVGTMGIPFSLNSCDSSSMQMINGNSFNDDDVKDKGISTSVMLEALAKAELAESKARQSADEKLPESIRRSLLSLISWAKEIPVFSGLPVEDRVQLIKATWSEVHTLKLVYRVIRPSVGSDITLDGVLHLYPAEDPVVASSIQKLTKECTATMQEIHLDETELSCLKLITLMNPRE